MPIRYITAGESHGPELLAIVEGVPAGLELSADDINADLARRQLGYGRGGRMKIETDRAVISSGVRHGITIGSPVGLRIKNADWENWKSVMGAEAVATEETAPVTVPRPGHADLSGSLKYGLKDIRSVLERASARETAARVAVGAVVRRLLASFGVSIFSHVVRVGKAAAEGVGDLSPAVFSAVDESPVRCLDGNASSRMMAEINEARESGESVGGIFEVIAFGLVTGLGSYASGPERLGGIIGGSLMSIPAIKGVEIGDGFVLAGMLGSKAHDEIFFDREKGFYRRTNHAGGLEGGMTTGEPLIVRACMKPIPTLTNPLRSVDMESGEPQAAFKERSDVCAVPAAAVVGEAMLAIELAGSYLKKFGGDSMDDMENCFHAYTGRLRESWP